MLNKHAESFVTTSSNEPSQMSTVTPSQTRIVDVDMEARDSHQTFDGASVLHDYLEIFVRMKQSK